MSLLSRPFNIKFWLGAMETASTQIRYLNYLNRTLCVGARWRQGSHQVKGTDI